MIDGIPLDLAPGGFVALIVLAILTDKLIWHTRLTKVEKERDRWQQVALNALGVADKLTVHSEVTTAIVASLPDPAAEGGGTRGTPPTTTP